MTVISNDPRVVVFSQIAKGLTLVGKGEAEARKGAALASVGMVRLLVETGEEDRAELVRHMAGVHLNAKTEPEAFNASWDFWKVCFSGVPKKDAVTFDMLTAKEEEDLGERREENASRTSAVRTLRIATAIAFGLHALKFDPAEYRFFKQPDMFAMSQVEALKVFGLKREKAIEKQALGVVISTHGAFNFRMLLSIGRDMLTKKGVVKAKATPAKVTPMRDILDDFNKSLENADIAAFKAADMKKRLHATLITVLNLINDPDLGEDYYPANKSADLHKFAETRIETHESELDRKLKASINGNKAAA